MVKRQRRDLQPLQINTTNGSTVWLKSSRPGCLNSRRSPAHPVDRRPGLCRPRPTQREQPLDVIHMVVRQ